MVVKRSGRRIPFERDKLVRSIEIALRKRPVDPDRVERMINGITGEPMEAEIFIGPCYYHRLKHLVSAKIHARNHGKVSQLTHQPLEGRSRDGGLRFGEMERDAMISHGNSRFLLERLFDMSDPFRIPICSQCGAMPSSNSYCSVCEGTDVVTVPMPYACKLLFQELNAMGIRINLFPEKDCTASSSLLHHLKETMV
jgi:DNA-directed RNA polymerase beta subunit